MHWFCSYKFHLKAKGYGFLKSYFVASKKCRQTLKVNYYFSHSAFLSLKITLNWCALAKEIYYFSLGRKSLCMQSNQNTVSRIYDAVALNSVLAIIHYKKSLIFLDEYKKNLSLSLFEESTKRSSISWDFESILMETAICLDANNFSMFVCILITLIS